MEQIIKDRSSYGNIFKSTVLFGGVKVFQILISIIRSKLIAIFIGPTGMGIYNLFLSTTDLVSSVSGLGLQTSAVRDVAQAYESGEQKKINKIITVLRGLIWITGLVGAIFTFAFAPALSRFAFNNTDYITAFRILSVIIIFNQLNVGQIALLQGTFHYKMIAKATLYGNLVSLILTIPFYYFLRNRGIVPALVISSVVTLGMSYLYANRVTYQRVHLSWKEFWRSSRQMILLGMALAVGAELSRVSGYVMNVFISHYGSLSDVGLYSVGVSITNSYVFMVLSAMASDYVPRLSALSGDDEKQTEVINKQIVMIALLLAPLVTVFMTFSKELIILLYSSEFTPVTVMVIFIMMGMLFRGICWSMAYGFVARGDTKMFLISETTICVISIILQLGGYYVGGFKGVGIATIVCYLIYAVLLYFLSNKSFNFKFERDTIKVVLITMLVCFSCMLLTLMFNGNIFRFLSGLVLTAASVHYSYKELDRRIHIKAYVKNRLKQKKN